MFKVSVFFVFLTVVLISCLKWDLDKVIPILLEVELDGLTHNQASVNSGILGDNSSKEIRERGFILINQDGKEIALKSVSGQLGNMSTSFTNLNSETPYSCQSYYITESDTFYSENLNFTTLYDDSCADSIDVSSTLPASSGSILYPDGLSSIKKNSSMNIEWNLSSSSQVHLYLYKNHEYILTIDDWLINDGIHNWSIPDDLPYSNCYRIVLGINNLGGNPGTLPNTNWGVGYLVSDEFTIY